jgi:hypothetical protein
MSDSKFDKWLGKVDSHISALCGLSHFDLADRPYYDMFEGGCTPQEAAEEALEYEGFFDFVFGG